MPSALSETATKTRKPPTAGGGLLPSPLQGDVEETDSSDNEPAHADLGEGTMSRSVPVEDASQDLAFSTPWGTGPCHTRMAGGERATATSTTSANMAKIAPVETKATAWSEPTDGL